MSPAVSVHPHYVQHLATVIEKDAEIELLPDVETIEAIIDVVFWASLRREEYST